MQKGNQIMKRIALVLVLFTMTAAVGAQTPAAQPRPQQAGAATPVQLPDPGKIHSAAVAVAHAVDTGQAGRLWDESAAITKRAVKRDAFIEGIAKSRAALGSIGNRQWLLVTRQQGGKNSLPAGNYISVEFVVSLSGGRTARELVSFRLDEDGIWRFTGYTIVR
ncbi:MAG TPA: DUF4019 domain-containing protein [Pseudoxanthomonas sp.]